MCGSSGFFFVVVVVEDTDIVGRWEAIYGYDVHVI